MQSTNTPRTAPRLVSEMWEHRSGATVEVFAPGTVTPDAGWSVVVTSSWGEVTDVDHGRDPVAAFGHAYRAMVGTGWSGPFPTMEQEPVRCACGSTTTVHAACAW